MPRLAQHVVHNTRQEINVANLMPPHDVFHDNRGIEVFKVLSRRRLLIAEMRKERHTSELQVGIEGRRQVLVFAERKRTHLDFNISSSKICRKLTRKQLRVRSGDIDIDFFLRPQRIDHPFPILYFAHLVEEQIRLRRQVLPCLFHDMIM